ncbi:MAG: aldose epimerase family protein [Clostridium perfringens]|nr:aldose epimerase family protein [Clostridium perfringens]
MEIKKIKENGFERYQLINDNDMLVEVLSLGGVITKILTKDKNGVLENVVLAYKNLEDYYENPSSFGAMIGRTAGRIGGGEFSLNGKKYNLHKNNNGNCLHGGNDSFAKKIWKVENINKDEYVGLKLSYVSVDGENGYPGNLSLDVYYTLNNYNELKIHYTGKSDKDTIVNMTNHSYFNLSGNEKNNILNQELIINADYIGEVDEYLIPTGKTINVKNTPFDFNSGKLVGKDINEDNVQLKYGSGYDHPWILNKKKDSDVTFYDKESGRVLEIKTNQKAVVCYSMNFNDELIKECGRVGEKYDAICFEAQNLPVGYNDCFIDGIILKAGEIYDNESIYKFYIKE